MYHKEKSKRIIQKIVHKTIALLMICLVLTLPFFSANTLAVVGTIEQVAAYGDTGIENVLNGKQDSLHVEVLASKDQGETQKVEIAISFDGKDVNADSCQLADENANSYLCKYTSSAKAFAAKPQDLTIRLWDISAGKILATQESKVFVDALAPEVMLDLPAGAKESFQLKYTVTDKACNGAGCEAFCVGLSKLFVTVNGNIIDQKDFGNETSCSYSFAEQKNVEDLPLELGDNEICVAVADKFGNIAGDQNKGVCKKIAIDTVAPVFDENSFQLIDTQTKLPVLFRKPVAFPVDLKINITDDQDAIKPSMVTADVSAMNPALAANLKKVNPASCTSFPQDIGNGKIVILYQCVWNSLLLSGNLPSDTINIKIEAEDTSNNIGTFTKSLVLLKDDSRPKIEKIAALLPSGQFTPFFNDGENNTVVVLINEQGAGLTNKHVVLKLQNKELNPKSCVLDSQWICIFDGITVAGETGDAITATVLAEKSSDDLGNAFEDKNTMQQFLLDADTPRFINVSIKPKGVERDSLLIGQQDIVEIKAFIAEKGAGLATEKVFVDTTGFDTTVDAATALLAAEDCALVSTAVAEISPGFQDAEATDFSETEDLYECSFEYAGTINEDDIKLTFKAEDNAGNSVEDDTIKGNTIKAVGVKEKKVDSWKDEITTETNELNRNLLWMTEGGTIVRAEFALEKKGSNNAYVHSFRLGTCNGRLDTEHELNGSLAIPFTEVDYLPTTTASSGSSGSNGKTGKLLLLTLPQMDKEILKNSQEKDPEHKIPADQITGPKSVIVTCDGAITQSSSKKSDVFVPDELFNVTITVPFDENSAIYNPGKAGLDKNLEHEDFIDAMDDIIDVLKTITEFLEKICKPANDIYMIINNICSIINSLYWLFSTTPIGPFLFTEDGQCLGVSNMLDRIWITGLVGGETDKTDFNEKGFSSLGYWCDLVLCTSCSEQWSDNLFGENGLGWTGPVDAALNSASPAGVFSLSNQNDATAVQKAVGRPGDNPNLGTFKVGFTADPRESLLTALICSPPCLPTIQHKFEAMKLIAVTDDACRNLAYKTSGSFDQCDYLRGKLACEFVVGEFWYLIPNLLQQYAAKWASYFTEKALLSIIACELNGVSVSPGDPMEPFCYIKRLEIAISLGFKAAETYYIIAGFSDYFEDTEDAADNEDDTEENINAEYENEFGTVPEY